MMPIPLRVRSSAELVHCPTMYPKLRCRSSIRPVHQSQGKDSIEKTSKKRESKEVNVQASCVGAAILKSTCRIACESRRDGESQFRSVQKTDVHLTSSVYEEAAGEMQRRAAKKKANDLQAAVSAYVFNPSRETISVR